MIESIAASEARREIRKQVALLTFEEFLERRKQGTDSALQPIDPVPTLALTNAAPETEDGSVTIEPHNISFDPVGATQPEAAVEPTTDAAIPETAEPEVRPAMPEPTVIELASDPPQDFLGEVRSEEQAA
jgi:hypothetical protein